MTGRILLNTTPVNIANTPTVIAFEYNMPYSFDSDSDNQFCLFASTQNLSTLSSDDFYTISTAPTWLGMIDPDGFNDDYPTLYDIALTEKNMFSTVALSYGPGCPDEERGIGYQSVVIRGYNNIENTPHYMYTYKFLDFDPLNSDINTFNQMRVRFSEHGTRINVDIKLNSSNLTSTKISDKLFTNILDYKIPYDMSTILLSSPVIFGLSYNVAANYENPIKIRNVSISR